MIKLLKKLLKYDFNKKNILPNFNNFQLNIYEVFLKQNIEIFPYSSIEIYKEILENDKLKDEKEILKRYYEINPSNPQLSKEDIKRIILPTLIKSQLKNTNETDNSKLFESIIDEIILLNQPNYGINDSLTNKAQELDEYLRETKNPNTTENNLIID
jgi:hypothetical protein